MFCSNCGAKLADGTSFCPECGTPVKQNTPAQGTYSQNPVNNGAPVYSYNHAGYSYNGNAQRQNSAVNAAGNPLFGILKNLGSSPLFIVCASLFTLSLLLSFWYAVGGQNQIVGAIYRMAREFGFDDYLWSYFNPISTGIKVYSVISLVPSILVAVGLWMTFASAHNKYEPSVKTAGLTMIKVINCINLLWSIIVLAVVEILGIVSIVGITSVSYNAYDSYYGYYEKPSAYMIGFVVGFMIAFAVVFFFEILFLAKINKTINSMKNAANNGNVKNLASSYVAVILIISAVFSLIGMVATLFSPIAAFQALVTCAMNICFAVLIFSYNSKVRPFCGLQQNTYAYAPQTYNQYAQTPVQPVYNNAQAPAPASASTNASDLQTATFDTVDTQPKEQTNDVGGGNAEE